ncbi:MAG: TatD family hydrolase [Bdellovibrionia bacterium]
MIESSVEFLLSSGPMSQTNNWVDAHGHLADPRWSDHEVKSLVTESHELGLGFFMQGGVSPEDWQRQISLAQKFPRKIGLCFGLHPYFVAQNEEALCEIALDSLAQIVGSALALGELGLDFRPHIMKDSQGRQLDYFEKQLELAEVAHKPVVLHLVQAHHEALRVFDVWGVPPRGGMIHSFNASAAVAEDYLKRGFYLSVGGPLCRPENKKLHQAVREIPLERLLLESDSPDQSPPQYKDQKNPPYSIIDVAEKVATLRNMSPLEVLDIATANFWRLMPNKNEPPATQG